jgi:two-component system OmpR family response regulator
VRALVVEDDPGMAAVLRRGLVEDGYAVDLAAAGQEGLWLATEQYYDVAVIDIGLPGMDGWALLRAVRAAGCRWPVLLLTARDAVADRVAGLDLGADDYVTKPFAFPELLARLRALVRRGPVNRPAVLHVGDLTLDPATRRVWRDDAEIVLTAKEFALLQCLMRCPGQVLSKSELIERVWDFCFDADSNVVEVHVAGLRRKLDRPFGRTTLQTARGAGYRIVDDRAER